jgi:nucleolar protein 12
VWIGRHHLWQFAYFRQANAAPVGLNEEASSDINSSHKPSKRKRKDDAEAPVNKPYKKHRPSGKEKASTIEDRSSAPLDQDNDVIASVTGSSKDKRKRKDSKKHREKANDHPVDDLEERHSNQRNEEQSPKRKGRLPKMNSSEPALNSPSQQGSAKATETTSKEVVEDRSSDDDVGPMNLVHESISGITPVTRRKSVYIPDGETKTDRDARTIFIGNLPFGILKSKVSV